MKQPVIIAAKRIAFGKYGGRLRHLEPESLLEPYLIILQISIQK